MIEPTINIEQVVREVLAELGVAPVVASPSCKQTGSEKTAALPSKSETAEQSNNKHLAEDSFVVNTRVVTMADVAGRLAGKRRVLVSREAIVTPAVRDELLRRGVQLAYSDDTNGKNKQPLQLVIMTTGTDFDPADLSAGVAREGLAVDHASVECIIAAADQLAVDIAKGGTLGVLLTRHTAIGLCLANRLPGVRAVFGIDTPSVAKAAAAVGANVLVADPSMGTFFQLRQMVGEFCRRGVRDCPAPFLARLA